jgi:threonylcarbamoyladenosine tRNA methylthiotransferase MtaB
MKKKKVAFYTLGCKVNFCETEALQTLFEKAGYTVTDFNRPADLYVINTCTVTGMSDHKSRKAIRRARRRSPGAIIVATGCYAQGFPVEIEEMEQADLVIGTQGREKLPQIVASLEQGKSPRGLVRPFEPRGSFEMLPAARRRGRSRGFLKIQEGCNQGCTYCIIPTVRGPLRSLPPGEAVAHARAMVDSGYREIVLTGIHLGLYGADLEQVTLGALLDELEKIEGLLRIRLSSIEPSDITGELVERIISSEKICPHLHIPLQSGDGEILKRMNRPYTPEEYLYLVRWLRELKNDLAISADVMVGFPGESEEHHRRSLSFVRSIRFSRLHVFAYSPRPGTPAAEFPGQVESAVKERRSREMIDLGNKMAASFRRKFIGSLQEVLIEKVRPHDYGEGFTPHYLRARVALDGRGRGWAGKLVNVKIEKEEGQFLWGVPLRQT